MGGGILDLVAKGGQDVYFICNPEISFFKKVYKRHTNFAFENHKYQFDGEVTFGSRTTMNISRNGDLIRNLALQFELPNLGNNQKYVNYIGYSLIDYIELSIGTTPIQRLTGEWLYIHNELNLNKDKKEAYNNIVGGKEFLNFNVDEGNSGGTYIVPLSFWFSQDIGLAIPYVALQYHEVSVTLVLKKFDKCWIAAEGNAPTEPMITSVNLNVEYVYLDSNERKLFAQSNHEYLIKQVQYSMSNNIRVDQKRVKIPLIFNHPIIELIFVVQRKASLKAGNDSGNDYLYFSKTDSTTALDTIKFAQLLLNNTERTPLMNNKEMRYLNPIHSHTGISSNNFIYMYSFSINPESFQPSGSCNFSRFDSKYLAIEFEDNITPSEVKVYAVNYNILRISKGMGGVAYIN